jgi:hypothetical protein
MQLPIHPLLGLGAPVSDASHARGRTQNTPFGRGTGSHPDDQVAIHIGGYTRCCNPLVDHAV